MKHYNCALRYSLLSLLILLSSASFVSFASGTIFSATCTVDNRVDIAGATTNQEINASQASISGGKLYVNNRHSSTGGMMRPSIGPSGTKKSAFYMYGAKHSFRVELTSPQVLAVGDVISAKLYIDNGTYPEANNGLWFSTSSTRPASAPTTKATTTSTGIWQDISYTVTAGDGLVGQSGFYIYYALRTDDSRTAFTDFAITRSSSSWNFKCENDSWTEHEMSVSAGVASYSIDLPADSRIEFCFDNNGTVYKNQGAIITTTTGWIFNTSDNNCKIHTGPAGTYTFALNTSSKAVTVTYPTVTHPNPHYVYFKNTDSWGTVKGYLGNTGNENKAAAWPGSDMQVTTTICGDTYYYAALNTMSGTYNVIIFNNGYSGYGNQTSDLSTTGSLGKYNANQDAAWHDFPCIVEIPGTVDKSPAPTLGNGATWWTTNTNYIDLNPADGDVVTEYAEWQVYLSYPGIYAVSETGHYENGHQYRLELRSSGSAVASFETTATWNSSSEDQTFDQGTTWDLSALSPGVYTLRVQNIMEWGEPKLKSVTLSYCIPKVPNQTLYGKEGDISRASGEITNAIVTTLDHIPSGAMSVDGRTFTIGSETIIAPETEAGILRNIPGASETTACTWRFDHWDLTNMQAVYFPTFAVGYETNGGTINEIDYALWYEYTGRKEDITELPMDVTKAGYIFAGWYQSESTKELFPYLTGDYYGDYAGIWCLRAQWILPCDEQKVITGVTLTGSSTYTTDGYDEEYIGTPLVSITGSGTADADVYDEVAGDETGYELGAEGDMVLVTLRTGTFRVGDVINVYITAKNTTGTVGGTDAFLELFYKTSAEEYVKLTHIRNVSTAGKYSYTLPSDDVIDMTESEAVSVGVYRKAGSEGQNPCVYRVEVVGCRDLYFDDSHNTHIWSDPKNWAPTYHEIPSFYQATRILKPCIVDIPNAQSKDVELYKDAGKSYNGQLTINANAALTVEGTIKETRGADNFVTPYPVAAADLAILATASNQGALAHGDAGSNTHATVQFYARGAGTGPRGETLAEATWQYMGVPFSDVSNAQSHYYDGWMCQWIENTTGNAGSNWKWIGNNDALTPFAGYCLTQNTAKIYTNTGTLVPSANQVLNLTYAGTDYKGWNMFANSWMAPINIAQFEDADFTGDVDKSIYLFNTGISDGETGATAGSSSSAAGNYVAVPINTAGSMLETNRTIAPMQGFYLLATGETSASVALDYNKLVRKSDHSALSVLPNRAPAKIQSDEEDSEMPRIIIDVKGEHFSDRLYIFEHPDQTNGFDNGWDGWKFEGESYAPQLMTRTNDLDLAVDVSPAFDGKRIAFRVGEDSEYTLHFSSTEDGLYLRDLTTNDTVAIAAGNTYSFMAFNSVSEERFEIIDRRSEIPSGWDEIKNDASFDILDMTVYTADGRLVLHRTNDFNKPLALPQNGTYIVYLTTTAGKHVHKIVF